MDALSIPSNYCLVLEDALRWLAQLPDACADAVITDPPYASGGLHLGARQVDPSRKYVHGGTQVERPTFSGDARDQRSYLAWCNLWMSECRRVLKPGGRFLCFTDWRQLPVISDALQCAGFTWRGVVAWDKGEGSRAPHTGYFRHQCEYIAWASNGHLDKAEGRGPFAGCLRVAVKHSDKHHITGKPTDLMRSLVRCVPEGGLIVDPFAGSGTTLVAALLEGRRAIGCELQPEYVAIARERCERVVRGEGA